MNQFSLFISADREMDRKKANERVRENFFLLFNVMRSQYKLLCCCLYEWLLAQMIFYLLFVACFFQLQLPYIFISLKRDTIKHWRKLFFKKFNAIIISTTRVSRETSAFSIFIRCKLQVVFSLLNKLFHLKKSYQKKIFLDSFLCWL